MIAARILTIFDMLNWATQELEGGFVLSPRVDAERIVGDATGFSRTELYLNKNQALVEPEIGFIRRAVADRITGKPLQYILNHQQFRYLDLVCEEGVLIPRPETEILVEEALDELKSYGGPRAILDIGCGTGAIAVSIAFEYENALVYAIDISTAALNLTKKNAQLAGVSDRLRVVKSDLFAALESIKGSLDLVISNPPYIPSRGIGLLQREVQFEPRTALDGGEDGLDFYRSIIKDVPEYLRAGGALLFEIGIGQEASITEMLEERGLFRDIETFEDYGGIQRVVKARRV